MTILIGCTFVKLYVTMLNMWLLEHPERNKLKAKGHIGFKKDYKMMDHIYPSCYYYGGWTIIIQSLLLVCGNFH